jgi:hypothetical protein
LAESCNLNLPAGPIDSAFAERLAGAITPLRLELALAGLNTLEERDRAIGAQWRMRIERAQYEADLAERRYDTVDPNNRLIAATLEQRWNEALQRLRDLEAELTNFEQQAMRAVTADQKRQILQLVEDFPRLWEAGPRPDRWRIDGARDHLAHARRDGRGVGARQDITRRLHRRRNDCRGGPD